MATIVTRAGKGSALTFVEGDANFTNLNTSKIELTNLSVGAEASASGDGAIAYNNTTGVFTYTPPTAAGIGAIALTALSVGAPASASGSGSIAYNNTTGVFTYTPPVIPSAGISNVVEDTTPQLGGDLDVDDFAITTSSSSTPLTLTAYVDETFSFDLETNTATGVASLINVNGIIALNDSSGVGYGAVTTQSDSIGLYLGINELDLDLPNITIEPELLALVAVGTAPVLELTSYEGNVTIQGLTYPNADGTVGQVLTTDGEGNLTFEDAAAGGIAEVVDDTTPQLGGNLDVNGNSIVSASNGNIVIAPNGTGMTQLNNIEYHEKIHDLGTTSGTITPDVANGNVQTITLNGNLTLNAFTSPVAGQSLTLIIDTNGTGRTLTSSMKFAGASKTLSTTDTTDIISVFYDGTNYWASLGKGFA